MGYTEEMSIEFVVVDFAELRYSPETNGVGWQAENGAIQAEFNDLITEMVLPRAFWGNHDSERPPLTASLGWFLIDPQTALFTPSTSAARQSSAPSRAGRNGLASPLRRQRTDQVRLSRKRPLPPGGWRRQRPQRLPRHPHTVC